jgi:hypothetical protein
MLLCAVVKRWKHTRRGTRRGKKRVEESIVFFKKLSDNY